MTGDTSSISLSLEEMMETNRLTGRNQDVGLLTRDSRNKPERPEDTKCSQSLHIKTSWNKMFHYNGCNSGKKK